MFACYFVFLSLKICLFSYIVVFALIQWSEEFFILYVICITSVVSAFTLGRIHLAFKLSECLFG